MPENICPYKIIAYGEAFVDIRLCSDEVVKLDTVNIIEAWQVVTKLQTKGWIQSLPTELRGDIEDFLVNLAPKIYSLLMRMASDPELAVKIISAIGQAAFEMLKSFILDMVVDRLYAAGLLLLCTAVKSACTKNNDGSADTRVFWLSKGVSFVLVQIVKIYLVLGEFMPSLLSSLKVEVPNSNNVGLTETGSKLYLHIYDANGRHVGFDKASNRIEIGIPGASYFDSGHSIVILLPMEITDFRYTVDATSAESSQEAYNLAILAVRNNGLSQPMNLVTAVINRNDIQEQSVHISSDGSIEVGGRFPIEWVSAGILGVIAILIVITTSSKRRGPRIKSVIDAPHIKVLTETKSTTHRSSNRVVFPPQ